MNSYSKGIISELIACIFLFFKGYKILKRRYKTHFGEIDIIAKKGNNLIAVEVKTRKNKKLAIEAIREHQINRIYKTLNYFISKNPQFINCNIRIDILLVMFNNFPIHIINVIV